MTIRSLAILIELLFPDQTVRMVDGPDPVMIDGVVYRGAGMIAGMDELERAINAEASSLELMMAGTDPTLGDLAWEAYMAGNVIDTEVRISVQPCDDYDMPTGTMRRKFTGRIDNFRWDTQSGEQGGTVEALVVEVVNRFDLRNLISGGTLTDADQQLRSPGDRFLERVPSLVDKTVDWPDL